MINFSLTEIRFHVNQLMNPMNQIRHQLNHSCNRRQPSPHQIMTSSQLRSHLESSSYRFRLKVVASSRPKLITLSNQNQARRVSVAKESVDPGESVRFSTSETRKRRQTLLSLNFIVTLRLDVKVIRKSQDSTPCIA